MTTPFRILMVLLAAGLPACTPGEPREPAEDRVADAAPDAGRSSGLPWQDFYDEVRAHALGYKYLKGDWIEDFGDAAFWGPAFLVRMGSEEGRGDYLAVADEAFRRNLEVLRSATGSLGYFLEELEEVLMAALGVIEVLSATGDTEGLEDLDAVLDLIDMTVEGFGTYLDVDVESYALNTYGPTTITETIALLNLRYADLLVSPRGEERLETAKEIMAVVDEVAWNGERYRFRPGEDKPYLYPNVVAIMTLATLHRLTGEEAFRDRALAVYDGIQVLKSPHLGCYYSPYSAETMGAKTEEYSTLSSQNYTLMALALLWEVTGREDLREEMAEIAAFIGDRLWQDGRILHHWIDGHIARPTDPEYFCSGCNLQFLYASWYARTFVYAD